MVRLFDSFPLQPPKAIVMTHQKIKSNHQCLPAPISLSPMPSYVLVITQSVL